MIGFVIVSHSARLAEGVCELAGQVAQGRVRLAPAGGTSNPENPLGTDAMKVLAAIEEVWSEDGVLVFMDLGSAVLSAETALEFLDEEKRARVHLCDAPLVEGAVAAVTQAAAGATPEEILREVQAALAGKAAQPADGEPGPSAAERTVTLPNRLGLHARPAAQWTRLARSFAARVTLENLTRSTGPADSASIHAILGLGARQGHQLRVRADGTQAREAVEALGDFLAAGCGEPAALVEEAASPKIAAAAPGQLAGIPASAGIALGPLRRLRSTAVTAAPGLVEDPAAEHRRLLDAIAAAQAETRELYQWAWQHAGEKEAAIFDAQALFLEDPELLASASRRIEQERQNAPYAWHTAAEEFAGRLAELDDPYLRARAADVADVAARVLRRLHAGAEAAFAIDSPAILAALDIIPSQVKQLDPALVRGLCLETGSASAHSVILARAMGIPTVVGLGPALATILEGTPVAIDGERGLVWIAPGAAEARELEGRRTAWLAARASAQAERLRPAKTSDGRPIHVFANINSVAGAAEAVGCGAEGVGVTRTEFLFLGRALPPDEEEQYQAYRAMAEALGSRPLVIRTLDAGGDKSLPYIEIGAEANPFLGWRGIRVTLGRRDLLRTQLRAILRAGVGHPVEVLLPMISSLAELREARGVLAEVQAELALPAPRVGVMIEVPAAVAVADQLAAEADFLSIGTNDLVQYVMAADRTNARVASIADPFQPAVLRLIRQTVAAGREAGVGVALCGELAADLLATPLLMGLGLEEFSVSAPLIPELKRAIARWTLAEAGEVAHQALALDSSQAVRRLLAAARR